MNPMPKQKASFPPQESRTPDKRCLIQPKTELVFRNALAQCSRSAFDAGVFVFRHNLDTVCADFDKLALPAEESRLLKCFYIDRLGTVSPKTCNANLRDLRLLFDFLAEQQVLIETVSPRHLHGFGAWLVKREILNEQKSKVIFSANLLLDFLYQLGLLEKPIEFYDYLNKSEHRRRRAPEPETIMQLDKKMFDFNCKIPSDIRAAYMVERLILCRISETLRMRLDCLSFFEEDIFLLSMDTTKKQPLGIPRKDDYPFCKEGYVESLLLRAIEEQMAYAQNAQSGLQDEIKGYLFVSTKNPGKLLTRDSFNRELKELCKKEGLLDSAGEPVSIASHAFRHFGVVQRDMDGRFTPQMIADEANHRDEIAISAYMLPSATVELQRTTRIQHAAMPERFSESAPQRRCVSERKYDKLLHQPGNRLIPGTGICNGVSCTPRFERCIKCKDFVPNPQYIPAFEQCCALLEERISRCDNPLDRHQLELCRRFLALARQEI